jgi:uncharacterized protein YozE (UPF0346 family)
MNKSGRSGDTRSIFLFRFGNTDCVYPSINQIIRFATIMEEVRVQEKKAISEGKVATPCFNRWLEGQLERSDSVGRLARSIKSDNCWPPGREDDYLAFRNHLRYSHSEFSVDAIMSFEEAWEEYQAMMRSEILKLTVTSSQSSRA